MATKKTKKSYSTQEQELVFQNLRAISKNEESAGSFTSAMQLHKEMQTQKWSGDAYLSPNSAIS